MITLKEHIDMMNFIGKNGSVEDFLNAKKPIEYIDFVRELSNSYPIPDNVKRPKTDKKIHTQIEGLVLGQFIMLEQIITGKTKLPDHLIDLEIAKLIIRPSHHSVFDNENLNDEKSNQEDILRMDVREVYWVLQNFIDNRNKTLFEDFSGVFYDPVEDEEVEESTEEEKTSEMLFNQQWYWYSIVRTLANEDVTKYSEVYMLPMSTVLPEMSYLAQRSKIESARQRQQQAMRKL